MSVERNLTERLMGGQTVLVVEVNGNVIAVYSNVNKAKLYAEQVTQTRRGFTWEREVCGTGPLAGKVSLYLLDGPESLAAWIREVPYVRA